jgi:hypothetical protein
MAPHRADHLAKHLDLPDLTKLTRTFDVEFEGEGTPNDYACFPAWVMITHPRLADNFRGAKAGADTPAERCARLVLTLLTYERQGRHDVLIDARKRLRDIGPALFERYMLSRRTSLNR